MTTRKLAGENRQDLVNILGLSTTEKSQFEDKTRVMIMMILCLKDMTELQTFYDIIQGSHKKPEEVAILDKVNIMLQKRKVSFYMHKFKNYFQFYLEHRKLEQITRRISRWFSSFWIRPSTDKGACFWFVKHFD